MLYCYCIDVCVCRILIKIYLLRLTLQWDYVFFQRNSGVYGEHADEGTVFGQQSQYMAKVLLEFASVTTVTCIAFLHRLYIAQTYS